MAESRLMILTLDDERALDPALTGAKAAWLARARQRGLPVLPGAVVTADVSRPYLESGMELLERFGSGRARITITTSAPPVETIAELEQATAQYARPVVVRSSSILEGSGEWSGAFTSYLDIRDGELPKAVLGCYASAFTQHTVERFAAARIPPLKASMAVLVQPALDPDFGGTARVSGDEVIVTAVAGSPAPLVQGWEPGAQARIDGDVVKGGEAIGLLGEATLRRIAATLLDARGRVGANNCEWALAGDGLWLLQLQKFDEVDPGEGIAVPEAFRSDEVSALAQLVRRHPGPLAEELILPWAIADPSIVDEVVVPSDLSPVDALHHGAEHAAALTAEVWGVPKTQAAAAATSALRQLRGPEPEVGLAALRRLRLSDRARGVDVLSAVATVRHHLSSIGAVSDARLAWHLDLATAKGLITGELEPSLRGRIGFDRWDPFNAAVVTAHGRSITGTPVSNGIAVGRMCVVLDPAVPHGFQPRDVVVGVHPVPGLAALLFDAAALITTGGGTAAHLFESARALAIPALCATRIEDLIGTPLDQLDSEWALAVDGARGTVHGIEW